MADNGMAYKIYTLRKEKGLTLEQVAEAVGVGKSTVRKWETGMIANMRRDKIAALARVLGVTPAYLMGWEEAEAKADILSDIIVRLRTDDDFLSVVKTLQSMDADKIAGVHQMLTALLK